MSRRQKRLERIQRNPKNVSFDDLKAVLEDFGFVIDRSSGSHHSFKAVISGETVLFVVPYRRPIKAVYVIEALRLIEEIAEADEGESDEPEDE